MQEHDRSNGVTMTRPRGRGEESAAKTTGREAQHRLSKPTAQANPLRKMRVCLACGREFLSEGPGNRRCERCKEDPIYIMMSVRRGTLTQDGRSNPHGKTEADQDEDD